MFIIPVLIIAVSVIAVIFISFLLLNNENRVKRKPRKFIKANIDEETAFKEAEACLKKYPNDAEALMVVGEHWYKAEEWEKAFKIYEFLSDIPKLPAGVDQSLINLRAANCAVNLSMIESAFKYALVAYALNPNNFEICYQLGNIEVLRGNYEKALSYLQKSYAVNPEYVPTVRLLGHTYFKLKQNKDALFYIRKSLDLAPNDKGALFTLAECYSETGQWEQAGRIYSHLRPDPVWGPEACLRLGLINIDHNENEKAVENFLIGLRHRNIRPDISVELHYQAGKTLLGMQKISEALEHLQHIQSIVQGYKDTDALIIEYKEMNANKNLQIFILAPQAEFVALCRKIVMAYYPKAKVKITRTQMNENSWADVVAEIDTPKWSDIAMFRFIRIQGAVGELVLRDFQFNLKNFKAGKGICLGVCQFSSEAKRFTEARLIDLIEKDRFLPLLKSIDFQTNNEPL
ncbi:MAG: tetratricopeptide repeat protein [Spirochaetaceae bacterium]|jgi:tetratricopeptide (TPR) repeat protein|nr:tetratricopeptide repeat protein [Spirochaetaceae bacterium]